MPIKDLFKQRRNSAMNLGQIYFWTSTIKDWSCVLTDDIYKLIILNSLKELIARRTIKIYGYVIMPNHIHIIWEMLQMNGKEMPHASFTKFTSHKIIEDLKFRNLILLQKFIVKESDRNFRLWQRDSLAILIDSRDMLEQKLDYIHKNPLQERWNLAQIPEDYLWSSAKFYMNEIDPFELISDYRTVF
ncbi:transposase [Pedobacter sp. Leaf170]|uniref:transposase n=1 Tax=Pedobacter sp. Leaf170 TaxID=2876558 RepID=UPI001E61F3CA|nr:transposase [Pedobacter sp. Leaf170]